MTKIFSIVLILHELMFTSSITKSKVHILKGGTRFLTCSECTLKPKKIRIFMTTDRNTYNRSKVTQVSALRCIAATAL